MRLALLLGVVAAVALLGGCGASLDGANRVDDASPDGPAVRMDAAIDAAPCTGGDARAAAPDGSCLMLVVAPQTFADGKATCDGLGGHLAILLTSAVDDAAEALAGDLDTFIGLTDEVSEGSFVWVDGTPLGFTNWELGEPNDADGRHPEDCAIIAGTRAEKGWDDRPCAPSPEHSGGVYAVLCQR